MEQETRELTEIKRLTPSAKVVGCVLLAVALMVITGLIIAQVLTNPTSQNLTSKGGRISLTNVTTGMKLQNNTPITGTFQPSDGASLYYFVTTKGHRTIGAGSILPSEKTHFSRNLTLNAKDHDGQDGQLEVYLQDTAGKRLDSVTVAVKIQ